MSASALRFVKGFGPINLTKRSSILIRRNPDGTQARRVMVIDLSMINHLSYEAKC